MITEPSETGISAPRLYHVPPTRAFTWKFLFVAVGVSATLVEPSGSVRVYEWTSALNDGDKMPAPTESEATVLSLLPQSLPRSGPPSSVYMRSTSEPGSKTPLLTVTEEKPVFANQSSIVPIQPLFFPQSNSPSPATEVM